MAKLYREVRAGRLDASEATRLTYILKDIRCSLEASKLEELEARMDEIADRVAHVLSRSVKPRPASDGSFGVGKELERDDVMARGDDYVRFSEYEDALENACTAWSTKSFSTRRVGAARRSHVGPLVVRAITSRRDSQP